MLCILDTPGNRIANDKIQNEAWLEILSLQKLGLK